MFRFRRKTSGFGATSARRKTPRIAPTFDAMEGRVVPSAMAATAHVTVAETASTTTVHQEKADAAVEKQAAAAVHNHHPRPHPETGAPTTTTTGSSSGSTSTVTTESNSLTTALETLSAVSTRLQTDLSTLETLGEETATEGVTYTSAQFSQVESDLSTALANGTFSNPTVQSSLQSEFASLYSGSSVSQATIAASYNAVVNVVTDFNTYDAAVAQVAADRAAILTGISSSS